MTIEDEGGEEYVISTVLAETADQLDDAHEEWMENQLLYGTPS